MIQTYIVPVIKLVCFTLSPVDGVILQIQRFVDLNYSSDEVKCRMRK